MVEFETKDGEGGWEGGRRKIAEGGEERVGFEEGKDVSMPLLSCYDTCSVN